MNHLYNKQREHMFKLQKKVKKVAKGNNAVQRLAQKEEAFFSDARIAINW